MCGVILLGMAEPKEPPKESLKGRRIVVGDFRVPLHKLTRGGLAKYLRDHPTSTERTPFVTLPTRIRALRLAAGLSQAVLAKRMKTAAAEISRMESGIGEPRLGTLRKFAKAIGRELVVEFREKQP